MAKQAPESCEINNLGYLTDAIFHHRDGEGLDRGHYYLIRTPFNPTYFWGNFILFKAPPSPGCFADWMAIQEKEFGPRSNHTAIGWDSGKKGDPSEFIKNGFELNERIVLSLSGPPTTVPLNLDLQTRALQHDWEWQSSIELQIAEGFEGVNEDSYRLLKTNQMANYRLMRGVDLENISEEVIQ